MKIAIDVSRALESSKTGIATYQASLFENLLAFSKDNIYLPTHYGVRGIPIKQYMGKDILSLRNPFMYRNLFLQGFFDRFLGLFLSHKKIDFIHSTAHLPVRGFESRTVMTIHDLIFMYDDPYLHNQYRANLFRGSIGKIKKIIAVSNTTKMEILKYFPFLPESRIEVVYQGAMDNYSPTTDVSVLRKFKNNFFGDENFKYILFLGTFTKRKNPVNVIKAYGELVKKYNIEHKLVFAGKPSNCYGEMKELIKSLNLEQSVVIKGYVEDLHVSHLYSGADVFIFPSYYEGFGLPVIEAMKCGCPCVVSNVSSLRELFFDAALMVDPDSVVDIAAAIYKLINDSVLSEKYRNLGFAKAKNFSWKKTAEQTLRVYQSLS